MRRMNGVIILAAVLGNMLIAAASAGADEAVSPGPTMDDMLRRIEQLEAANQRQAAEIDELRATAADDWLTEQRAAEIRAIVSDVLADADTRSSLLNNGMTAGWQNGFFLASTDNRFKLQVGGLMQARWIYNYHDQQDPHRSGFENTRTRLVFSGHMFGPDTTYLIRGGFSRDGGGGGNNSFGEIRGGNFQLYDAWFRWSLNNEWTFRFGQFKLPFNREELVEPQYQLAVERSLINESLNVGRSQGIELQYWDSTLKAAIAFSDGGDDDIGQSGTLVATAPANTPALDEDTEFAVTGRVEHLLAGNWKQFEDFTSPMGEEFGLLIGYGAHGQMGEFGSGFFVANERNWAAGTVDISAEWGGANAFASFTYHYIDAATLGIFDAYGAVIQGGMYVTPKTEIFTRFEYGGLDGPNVQFSNHYLVTIGVNYYIQGHDLKWTTDMGFGISQIEPIWAADFAGYRTDAPGAEPQVVFRTQFQLVF